MSYAHADEKIAARLHNALETYRVPKALKGREQGRLHPIFRDVTELTAHHSLSEKIQDAVKSSRFLIVLCSPAAKISHWVNEEIRLFRRLHGEGAILAVIVDGVPETAFPPALTADGREPLAADMTGGREGFRFGVTQLAASMLGVGLDRLAQRDARRRRFRAQALTAGSLIFAGIMGGMAWTALDARDEAEKSRDDAEALVEYMLTDLIETLDGVGKLNVLDSVGDEVISYYQAVPLSEMDDQRLLRYAEARQLLGRVALDQADLEQARRHIDDAVNVTEEILRRNLGDTEAIFTHSQSVYFLGSAYKKQGDKQRAYEYFEQYDAYGKVLYNEDPKNIKWIKEAAWGSNNLGNMLMNLNDFNGASKSFHQAIRYFEEALLLSPEDTEVQEELSNTLAGAASIEMRLGHYKDGQKLRRRQLSILKTLIEHKSNDVPLQYRNALATLNSFNEENEFSLSRCEGNEFQEALNNLGAAVAKDTKNIRWQKEYVGRWFYFIETCRDVMPPAFYEKNIDGLREYTDLIGLARTSTFVGNYVEIEALSFQNDKIGYEKSLMTFSNYENPEDPLSLGKLNQDLSRMRAFARVGNKPLTKKFAKKILDREYYIGNLHPDILIALSLAQYISVDCKMRSNANAFFGQDQLEHLSKSQFCAGINN